MKKIVELSMTLSLSNLESVLEQGLMSPPILEQSPVTDRISSVGDRILYKVYSFFNPPSLIPIEKFYYEDNPEEGFDRAIPESYEAAKADILSQEEITFTITSSLRFARDHMEEYADPEFRIAQAREYFIAVLEGRVIPLMLDKNRYFCTFALCNEEMHDLYKKEYKQKCRDATRKSWMWLYNISIAPKVEENKEICAKHKEVWNKMSTLEKAKGICLDGSPSRYLLVVAVTVALVAFFFRPRNILST